jgi:hypothetical protein
LLSFINADCKKNIVTPEDIQPGSRNYTWTVDTVYGHYNPFTSITGTSPTDLWTANPGDADKIFYHYDGVKWTTDLIARPFSPFSIFSFSQNDVWSAGDLGNMTVFNGRNNLDLR